MKRAMILLILLPALLLSGSVYAAARVNSTRDAACFSPVVLTGDPELCEGVTIRAYTSFSDSRRLNRLYHELSLDAASGEDSCVFSLNEPIWDTQPEQPDWSDRLVPQIASGLYPNDLRSSERVLPEHMQYVADKTPAGGEYEETVRLADFYETWPFYCAVLGDYPEARAEELNEVLRTTLARPVPEDATQTVEIKKRADGSVRGYGTSGGSGGLSLSCDCYENFYLFTLRSSGSEDAEDRTEFWLMDLRWSEEDGLYAPDTASLRLLAECEGRSYMYYAPDGGALLVESGPDSSLLTRVTPAGELAEAYTIPRPEGTYSIHIETGEDWVLADTLDGVYAFDYSGGALVEGPFFDIGGAPGYELLSRPAGEYRYTLEDIYEYDGERRALFLDFAPSDEDEPAQDYYRWQVQNSDAFLICADALGNVCVQQLPSSLQTEPAEQISYTLEMR